MATTTRGRPRVVIIGAGMAGLAAAVELVQTDMFDITILEAMDRPGGRIHTSWQMGSALIEMGANWIHGEDGNPLYQLAKENGLLLKQDPSSGNDSSDDDLSSPKARGNVMKSQSDKEIHILEEGTIVPFAMSNKVCLWYDQFIAKSRSVADTDEMMDVGRYIKMELEKKLAEEEISEAEKRVIRLVAKWCLRVDCLECACQSIHDLSLAHYIVYEDLPGDFYTCLGKKGYQGVLDVLLKKLPEGVIKVGMPVEKVVWNPDSLATEHSDKMQSVTLKVKGHHHDILADHVIFTSSLGYLKENHLSMFDPPLSTEKQEAIRMLQFGTVNKVFLKFKKPFWERIWRGDIDGMQLLWDTDAWHDGEPVNVGTEERKKKLDDVNKPMDIVRRFTGFDTVEGHDNVLCAWISGVEAEHMEQLSDEEIEKMCIDVLQKFLKQKIPKPTQVVASRWHSNPYIRGSYSSPRPVHATGNDSAEMLRPVCVEQRVKDGKISQHPVLLFAGEAYSKRWFTTVHGAMSTGQQQAQKLIKYYETIGRQ